MYGKSEKLIRLQKENENVAGAVEVLFDWAKKAENEEVRKRMLANADSLIRACLVRK